MRKYLRSLVVSFILLFSFSLILSSCRVFRGDPRKNCNHPKHGEYMMEQRQKNLKR